MDGPRPIFDIDLLTLRKDRAAARAEHADYLLRHVADDLLERLALVNRPFALAADVGAWHGLLGRRLRRLTGMVRVIDVELSTQMLALCSADHHQASPEALRFAEGTLDLVTSGLALHLVNDLPGALVQIRRALKPDGLFLASLLGGETLKELRQAWLLAETDVCNGASPRVAPFVDVRDLGGLLQRAGFALPVVDSERLTVAYASPLALMQEIKAMGASNMLAERSRKPVTRRLLVRAAEIYQERFALPGGRVPATFEILTATAWSPHESQQKPLLPGTAKRRLADALGVPERKP